jgi:hypothetical protein
MTAPDYLPIAVRAHTERRTRVNRGNRVRRDTGIVDWRPNALLVFDCETTVDTAQSLLFGCYRYYRVHWRKAGPVLHCIDEGLLYADELPYTTPKGLALLREYVHAHEPAVDTAQTGSSFALRLLSRAQFVDLFYDAAFKGEATVVGFNLPFDLSRIALQWRRADYGRFAGGLRFTLGEYQRSDGSRHGQLWRPQLAIKTIDAKRALIGFLRPARIDPVDRIPRGSADGKPEKEYVYEGSFLDLHTLDYAFSGKSRSLKVACDEWGAPYDERPVEHGKITPDYIDYCREDVDATARLYVAQMREYVRHPITLPPTQAFSAASIGKAYLHAMGIRPVLERQPDFPREQLGYAMVGYYGGRTECHVRRVAVPVVYCDFASMYPTVCALLDVWRLIRSNTIKTTDEDPARLQARLDGLEVDDLFDRSAWPRLRALVQITPDEDILPTRARYGTTRSLGIGLNHYSGAEQWYVLPDIVASTLLTGRAPRILRVLRIDPGPRRQSGLQPTRLRGKVAVDPAATDFFRTVVEQRNRLTDKKSTLGTFLKTLANATAYGIYAEMNRQEPPGRRQRKRQVPITVYGQHTFDVETSAPERRGEYYFPPVACLIASAARLMLALLERRVTDAGGTWAFADTDSMAIVASKAGELVSCPGGPETTSDDRAAIRALSWSTVDQIVQMFTALNPYDSNAVPGSILEVEKVNRHRNGRHRQIHAYAISAKRYALFTLNHGQPTLLTIHELDEADADLETDEEPTLLDVKQHGLGHLLNPADPEDDSRAWIQTLWEQIVRADALNLPAAEPDWLDRPAVTRTTVSTPEILRAFETYNTGKPAHQQIRPYNFLLAAHTATLGHPTGADPERFQLIAPYRRDARQWRKLRWTEYHTGHSYRITTTGQPTPTTARVQTYRDVLADYRTHPEPKSLGPDGKPCDRATVGELRRRHVRPLPPISHIGKETNKHDERQANLGYDPEPLTEYADPKRDVYATLVAPVLGEPPVREIAATTGVSTRTVERARAGHTVRPEARDALTAYAIAYARSRLGAAGITPPRDGLAVLAAYLSHKEASIALARGGDAPVRLCEGPACEQLLTGRQRRWHSDACRQRAKHAA